MASLLVIGNPLLDISATVTQEYLEKYGLKAGNAILAEAQHLPIYQEIIKGKVDYIAGGAAQNSARVAEWFLQAKATAYIGCIGNDENGRTLKQVTEAAGVSTHYLVDQTEVTGTCAVLLTNKERSLVTNLGAANKYNIAHFQTPEIQAVVSSAKFFYSTGYFITVSVDTLIAMGKHAAEHNKPFLYNLSAPFVIQFFGDQLNSVLPYVDVLFANDDEAKVLGNKMGWGEDLAVIAEKAAQLPKINDKRSRMVVFTQGANPTVVYHDGKVTQYAVPPVPSAEIVDTNGAGDSFVGGFLAGYTQGKEIAKCCEAGHYAAGQVIRRSGCTLPETREFSF
jgi:adenosine kinase